MNKFRSKTLHLLASLVLVCSSALFSQQAVASSAEQEDKWPGMVADLVIARPIGFFATVIGSAVFVVSLPFTLVGGNVPEAADALVIKPAKYTFVRPLGE